MRKMINKSMRRLFAILLSALIMMSAVVPAIAAEDESGAPAESGQTLVEESKDESKAEELVVEEPKDEEVKDEEAKDEETKDEEAKDEEPKDEEPKDEEPKDEEPEDEEAKDEEPKDEEPKDEEPEDEEPKDEEVKDEEPKDEELEDEEKAFADLTVEEQYAALKEMSEDEEIEAALATLTEEQVEALKAYIEGLEPAFYPETVVSTYAGPFMPAVKVESSARRRLLAKSAGSKAGGNTPDGLELDKNIVDNEDGTYTITLDSYTTGEVTSSEISMPVDIVLVLDQSGSMAYNFSGGSSGYSNSRQKAMKDAVVNFIDNVHEKYDDLSDHRISIVTFGSDVEEEIAWTYADDSGFSSLEAFVNGLPQSPSGATNVAAAMGRAQHLVTDEYNYTGSNNTRQKVVVVFTDGIPTTSSNFSTGVATGAINAGKNIKDAGATVYTVGIFQGADPSELYGASGFDTNSNGSVGSYWQSSQFLIFGDIEDAEIPAGNRFLNYLSSNFRDAANIGLTARRRDFIVYRDYRFTINQNYTRTSSNYYLTADDANSLNNVFQSIAEQIATPTIDLGSSTVVKDIIAPQLQIPEGATVKFFTQDYNGTEFTGAKTEITDGSVHLEDSGDDNTVNVTGFDFNANCVTEEAKEDGSHGKKLIIEITVEPGPNFLGGTIDTNGANSGIYPEGADTPIGTFPVPNSPFKMKAIVPDSAERNIYLSTEDQLAETFADLTFKVGDNTVNFNDLFNGVNNAGVNYELLIMDGDVVKGTYRIPAGKTPSDEGSGWASIDGSAPVLPAKEYTIDSVVKDKNDSMDPVVTEGRISLNVFKPTLTYVDKNVYYAGVQIAIADVVPTEIVWKCGDTLDTAVDMDTTKPTLTYTYDGVTGTTVDQTTDYTVEVTAVKNGEVDLLTTYPEGSVTFKRNCSVESLTGAAATAAEAFKIHVYTPSFTFNDDVKYYGEAYTLPTVNTSSIEWKNGTTAAPASMDNTAPAVAVTLTPTPATAFDDGYVQVTTDVPVKAVITLGGTDVTAALITAGKVTRTCTPAECETVPAATADTAFVVHVKTVSLTIKKSIEGTYADMTKTYSFNVSYSGNVDYSFAESTFTLGHNGEKELTGLPVGSVTVEESGVLEGYTVAFDLNSAPGNPKTPSGGKASESLTLTAGTEENTIVVHNTLATVPETGISLNDGMSSALLLMIALGGMAAMAVLSVVKRFSGRAKLIRK